MLWSLVIGVCVFATVAPAAAQEGELERFRLLATNRTGTMEEELNEGRGGRLPACRHAGRRDGIRRQ